MVPELLVAMQLLGFSPAGARAQDPGATPSQAQAPAPAQTQAPAEAQGQPPTQTQSQSAATAPKKKSPKGRRGGDHKETEGTTAPNRFEADTVIKSQYKLDGEPLEVDPD